MSDLKLKIDTADAYFYPDLMVTCETAPDSHFREQPKLIIEVLSDSTAKYDQDGKRQVYQTLESLGICRGCAKLHGRARLPSSRDGLGDDDVYLWHDHSPAFFGTGGRHRANLRIGLGLTVNCGIENLPYPLQ